MNISILTLFIGPLLALIIGFTFNNKQEKPIYLVTMISAIINYVILAILLFNYLFNGQEPQLLKGPVLYHAENTEFSLNLLLDGYSLVYAFVATFLIGVIIRFSRYYLHREKGYKRFFNNLKFFYIGILTILLAGNIETLFIGWEIIGVTSFFLIGFYRERYLPVKNALKIVSLYRVADVALLLAIWLAHHYYGHSINFLEISNTESIPHYADSVGFAIAIPLMFLIAAMVKSAQFPFSSWLPRAMEGPTTSSAIFYGSLSVHIGVFILIRTAPFWEDIAFFPWLVGAIGLTTTLLASSIARVQSTIKTQIAYSSIAQIGIMFIEVALGLYWLAILHFIGNSLLRSYQLLVSPSVLSYKIHDQFFHFHPPGIQKTEHFLDKIKLSIYVLSIKEFNLDRWMFNYLWNPLKKLGSAFSFLSVKVMLWIAIPIYFFGLWMVYNKELLPEWGTKYLPEGYTIICLVIILKAFVERKSILVSWGLLLLNQLYQTIVFGLNDNFEFTQVHIYLSGIIISSVIGFWVIVRLRKKGKDTSLNQFHGYVYEHPRLAFVFVVACLGLAGFPITPTFIGEDVLLGHIHENQMPLLILMAINLILDGLVIFRMYSRLFLGQHKSGYHEFAYRSS